jgi:hypothetical protein
MAFARLSMQTASNERDHAAITMDLAAAFADAHPCNPARAQEAGAPLIVVPVVRDGKPAEKISKRHKDTKKTLKSLGFSQCF